VPLLSSKKEDRTRLVIPLKTSKKGRIRHASLSLSSLR